MTSNALVQTRIDAEIKERATAVLAEMGLTVSDAVRILLTRTAKEGALPRELLTGREDYEVWFHTKVQEALDDARPDMEADAVEAHFRARRLEAVGKVCG
jgi:DNA-damage-inducible protein J